MMVVWEGLAGFSRERQRIGKVARKLADFQSLHEHSGKLLLEWSQRNFAAEGALLEDSARWPPLARSTLASRRRRGRGLAILEDSGRLRSGFVLKSSSRRAVVDNPVPYAAVHQTGLGVPQRRIFPSQTQAQAIVFPMLRRHVEEALG